MQDERMKKIIEDVAHAAELLKVGFKRHPTKVPLDSRPKELTHSDRHQMLLEKESIWRKRHS